MMIKIAVVFCAVLATSLVFASDVEEQAMDDLFDLMLSEEASPEDKVALQGWFERTFHKVKHGLNNASRFVSGACNKFGYSPEEARAKILAAYPDMKDQVKEDLDVGKICRGAHALHRFTG